MNVDVSVSAFDIGKVMIGDKNCHINQNVVNFPISLPRIAGGAMRITHMFVLGIIIPIPRPAKIIARTTSEKLSATEMQTNPAAINRYPSANTERKLSLLFNLE